MPNILQLGLTGLITLSSLSPVTVTENQLVALAEPTPVVLAAAQEAPLEEISNEPHTAQTLRDLIASKAEEAGVDRGLALRIAFCESTYRQFAKDGQPLRGIHNPDDVGLFQINEHYHLEKSRELGFDISTTEGNIDYAVWMLERQGPGPWVWSKPCWNK
jgi:hypothetical protein